MLPAELTSQHKESDPFTNESDLLLSNRYILNKEIKDLNKTLLDSTVKMSILENEVEKTLKLKTIVDSYILAFDEIEREPGILSDLDNALQNKITELIEKLNNEPDLHDLLVALKKEERDFIRVKQLLIDNCQKCTTELSILREKIALRNEADSDVYAQRDSLETLLKTIQEEIAGLKPVEDEEKLTRQVDSTDVKEVLYYMIGIKR